MVELQSTLFHSISRVLIITRQFHRKLKNYLSFRSDRYRCLNNIPDYKSSSFKDLNDEQKARELPGRFSDLDDQCRRAFGSNFEYCKDLSHGVNIRKINDKRNESDEFLIEIQPKCTRLYCREIYSNLTSCITNHAHWLDGTLCSEPRSEIKVNLYLPEHIVTILLISGNHSRNLALLIYVINISASLSIDNHR